MINKEKINSKDISVVVQGAIDKNHTKEVLKSIRKVLPNSVIILSTWKDSNVKELDYDILVENEDPGCEICDVVYNVKNNINRQILSTKNGLKTAKTKYAMKLRSDIKLINDNFVKTFGKFDDYRNTEVKIFTNRIIINNLYCADPELTKFPFHISDWVQFGLTDDMLQLWDIPLQTEPEGSRYFLNREKPEGDKMPTWLFKYIPEQYIGISCLQKNNINVNCTYYSDLSNRNLELTYKFFSNNFVILDYTKFGIEFLKFNPYKWDYEAQMNFDKWQDLYIKYCNPLYKKPILNRLIKKLRLEKFLKKLHKHSCRVLSYINSIISEIISTIYYLLRIFIRIITLGAL